jgi:glycopeptide antibiotics resistance protein
MLRSNRKIGTWLLFGLYCGLMLWLLFFHRIGETATTGRYNLQLWDTVNRYLWVLKYSADSVQRRYAAANLVGNVVLFQPLGIFLPVLFARLRTFWRLAITALLMILSVEALQFFTGLGALDVDDLVLNLMGILLGYLLWRGIQTKKCNHQ